ncbi:MAG: acyl-CoA dehydrogenase family protein [Pseudomonadales bacterium]
MDTSLRSPVAVEERRLAAEVRRIADTVARPAATDVDQAARFPVEAFNGLKEAGVLAAGVPADLGGGGCSIRELAGFCQALGEGCAATAMILAMHYIQVACIVHHGGQVPAWQDYLRRLSRDQRLIASVTSEVGTDGDLRRSIAAIAATETGFTLTKWATTISYGAYADDLLITARRNSAASEHDQVLVLSLRGEFELADRGEWDTLGMRGTCSPGARVEAHGSAWQILPAPFADIAPHTMVPYSHILWAACWLGIAIDASRRARSLVQGKARRNPDRTPRGADRLVDLDARLQLMRADHEAVTRDYDRVVGTGRRIGSTDLALALRVNNLKLSSSQLVREVVLEAMEICGIVGYRNDSEFTLGRHLRDALSASLMISNDRIRAGNSTMQLVHKDRVTRDFPEGCS